MSRTIAVLSPYFPPATLAGVHRARHLAKHLPAFGWQPIIVRADERHYTERLDPALAALVPSSVEQVRTGTIPAPIARAVGVGDIGLRGYLAFRGALTALAKTQKIDAVLITGSPFYPLLLARYVRETLKMPVILDFQDPWVSADGARRRRWSKGGLSHQLALTLEPRAVRYANFITSVSERQNDEMATRYPWLDRARMAAIPIGGDPEDLSSAKLKLSNRNDPGNRHKFELTYVGSYWDAAEQPFRTLISALALLKAREPRFSSRLCLKFIGTGARPDFVGEGPITRMARAEGVEDLVVETPQRVPFLEALSLLTNSSGLLMIGSDEPHYTASKVYPNLMAKRPFISIFHAESSAHAILAAAGGGRTFAFAATEELLGLAPEIADALQDLVTRPESFGTSDPAIYEPFTARNVARQFAAVFEQVSG